jgi:hypothetical protein
MTSHHIFFTRREERDRGEEGWHAEKKGSLSMPL